MHLPARSTSYAHQFPGQEEEWRRVSAGIGTGTTNRKCASVGLQKRQSLLPVCRVSRIFRAIHQEQAGNRCR